MDSIWGNYRRWNNITGWFIFLFSAIVYLLTLEPTVSFWDCGEFILSAFKLQVGHPPGAPLIPYDGKGCNSFCRWRHLKSCINGKHSFSHLQRICNNVPFLDNHTSCQKSICNGNDT